MLSTAIPAKFHIPFANNAGGPYIRPVPQASQVGITPGAASLYDGFPPVTFQPEDSGGTPPAGQDFNGIFNAITKWIQWLNAGAPVFYDVDFALAISGYPKGAMIAASSPAPANTWWLSSVENNITNPNAGGAGWIQVVPSSPATVAPLINGTAAVGTSLNFARQDHVHPTDTSRAALSYVNSTFETIAAAAATYLTINNPTSSGTSTHTGNYNITGDIRAQRAGAAANTGVIFLGSSGARYLYYDGTNYVMPGAELYVNGVAVVNGIQTAQSTGQTGINNAAAAQGTANTGVTNAAAAQARADTALVQALGSTFPFGGGYQDVTSIRALATNYTNTSGRVIFVFVRLVSTSGARHADGYVNGVLASHAFANVGSCEGNLCFAVSVGQSYQVAAATGSIAIAGWFELR